MKSRDKLESFIRDSEEMLSQMISGSPIPTFVIDRSHTVTHFNRACEMLTGIPAKDMVGTRNQWKAFYAQQRPVMADIILDDKNQGGLESYYTGKYRVSTVKSGAYEAEDFFPDLGEDGRWLFFTAAPVKNSQGDVIGAIETLQDITHEKRVSELNSAMLRISKALQNYAYLEDLLHYISSEIKQLLKTEGALVVLYDEEAKQLYLPGIAYDDPGREEHLKDIRFSLDEVVAGQVIRTGIPVIQNEIPSSSLYHERDRKMGYTTRNLVESPVYADDRIIGVLCGINKKEGRFSDNDVNLLNTLAGTVALAIENVRFSEELRKAYRNVRSLNAAKDKAINHLSHELITPLTILAEAVSLVEEELAHLAADDVKPLMTMIRRNLNRLMDIKDEVSDIIKEKDPKTQGMMAFLLDQCSDYLSVLSARSVGDTGLFQKLKNHIDGIFKPGSLKSEEIDPADFISKRLDVLAGDSVHRNVRIIRAFERTRSVHIPHEILTKIVDGLVRNAVENTPDGGQVQITVRENGPEVMVRVRDYGVGIPLELQPRIFEGFFPTQDMTRYATRKPFDFNAGGKGADLLRTQIFSETYGFTITMDSTPCPHCHGDRGPCPGNVALCPALQKELRCEDTGGTEFVLCFS